jgi:hypothetical protein
MSPTTYLVYGVIMGRFTGVGDTICTLHINVG